ncbi:MAG: glycosyltransferase family 9 protein [Gemmatimonadaceae bacterium]|nr:glycosyltransferase family 9 protein [Gemmatimonadaceae bacterium]
MPELLASTPVHPPRRRLQRAGKALELAWRRGVFRVLAGAIWVRDRLPRGARAEGPMRVLFLRPDRIGDMVVTTGVLRAIGGAPGLVMDVLAAPANAAVLASEPAVRAVLVLDRKRFAAMRRVVREARAQNYDVIVDCMPTAPSVTMLMIMLAIGARRRVGTSGRGLDHILDPATPSLPLESHIVDHLSLLVPPFRPDHATLDLAPVLVLSEVERVGGALVWTNTFSGNNDASCGTALRLLVNISAGKAARWWPASHYAEVINEARAVEPSLQVLIMAAPHEGDRAQELADLVGAPIAPTGSLRAAFAVAGAADVVFTPDTSIAHAAGALGVPVVDMLLEGKASGWGVYRTRGENLESPTDELVSLSPTEPAAALVRVLRAVRQSVVSAGTEPALTSPQAAS